MTAARSSVTRAVVFFIPVFFIVLLFFFVFLLRLVLVLVIFFVLFGHVGRRSRAMLLHVMRRFAFVFDFRYVQGNMVIATAIGSGGCIISKSSSGGEECKSSSGDE